jgi:bifunctional DNA-binding transcriptional regulator/antitoxin component of YhaV-PrlF toxin-antitoxin module
MRITTKGQVTIPLDVRERLGFLPHTDVQFRVEGHVAVLEKRPGADRRGTELIRRMRGTGTVKMTTDEILALTRDPAQARTGRPKPRARRGRATR